MTIFIKDPLRASVEAATGGHVTVLYNAAGHPNYMNIIPKFHLQDIDASLGTGVHPAFIVNGVERPEIFIGQYLGMEHEGALLSLPNVAPTGMADFDTCMQRANANGPLGERVGDGRTTTGSGPVSWRHNGQVSSIADLNGNLWEWLGGYRLWDGEIQVLPNNDAADQRNDHSRSATSSSPTPSARQTAHRATTATCKKTLSPAKSAACSNNYW